MKVIAFGHQKRVGKDTAAGFAMTILRSNSQFRRIVKAGFADKLKDVCHQLYAWAGLKTREYYEENPNEREIVLPLIGKTPRQIWISFGNEVKLATYEFTWADYLLRANANTEFLIVSDMRFPVEANRIKAIGGKVIKIVRPDVPHTSDAADDPLLDYTGWDHIIVNDGGLNHLYDEVGNFLRGYV